MQELSVGANRLKGTIPLALGNLPDILLLNMSFNHLSGTIPPGGFYHGPSQQRYLQTLQIDLSHNQLSGSIPGNLLQAPFNYSSAYISLSYNLLNGGIPAATEFNSTYHFEVDLSYNQLRGPVPVSLASSATFLNLENNLLSGDIVDVLSAAFPVGRLGPGSWLLSNNYFTGELSLLASYNPVNLAVFVLLRVLDLRNNNLSCTASESIPDPISTLLVSLPIAIQEFNVGGNDFSGTSLPMIAPILLPPGLQILDLSNCQLEGNISGAFFPAFFNGLQMPALTTLNLSQNLLTGPVPENVTQMPSLQILDLSYNNLAGPLPRISHNLLVDNASFVGNKGLCGYPLSPCPPPVFQSHGTGVQSWTLAIIICVSVMITVVSCLLMTWRWRVYHKLHEQDADLIQTLMERDLVTLMPLRNLKKATNNFDESAQN